MLIIHELATYLTANIGHYPSYCGEEFFELDFLPVGVPDGVLGQVAIVLFSTNGGC